MSEKFEIVPAGQGATAWLIGLTAFLGIAQLVVLGLMLIGNHAKEILPLCITLLVLFAVLLLLLYTVRSSKRTLFELDREYLRVRGDIFGGRFPLATLEAAKARLIDIDREPEYKPRIKVCGSSVPGYQSGRFKLKNKEKAWIYLTDLKKVVYVPTRKGYAVMMSAQHPERMVDAFHRLASHHASAPGGG
jgi:hypothetical protein